MKSLSSDSARALRGLFSIIVVVGFHLFTIQSFAAGTLTGSMKSLTQNSVVNLSTNGTIDWVHWGLYNETSINRKAGVAPLISDFAVLDNTNGFAFAYQYSDNENGYTWTDGDPIAGVTNTTTGVWAYGVPFMGTGFQITAPAGTEARTLKVYCGVFAGGGRFEASLSDESAPAYTTTFQNIPGNGPSREVTIHYAANSPGQTLTVRWTLQMGAGQSPNVTLQAATLSAEGANNPPIVRLTSPAMDANIAQPASVSLTATASDLDGSVTTVDFYANDTWIGSDNSSPYTATWNSPAPGRYQLVAVASDNNGESTTSMPVDVTIYSPGGSLSGSSALPSTSVSLTTEGTTDWQHWGLSPTNLANRKASVPPQISALRLIGTTNLETYTDNYSTFSWSDGTPTSSTPPVPHGVFVYGRTNGFEFEVAADTTPRTLKVYAGLYGAQGHFEAWLNDYSAPTYHNHSLSNLLGNDYAVFTLSYSAASAGKSLVVHYVPDRLFDSDFGNITLQAATLQGGGSVVSPVTLKDLILTGTTLHFSFLTQTGHSYLAQWRSALGSATGNWQTFATVPGDGALATVSDTPPSGTTQRFYRVVAQ